MIKAFIILLGRDERRRRNVQRVIAEAGLDAEIFPAVDGLELTSADVERLVRRGRLDAERAPGLKRGQIACALSHVGVLERVLARGLERALVLEDDVRLEPDFSGRLDAALRETPPDFDLLYLYDGYPDSSTPVPGASHVRASGYPLGAVAYAVSRKGASRILERIVPIRDHLDEMLATHVERGHLKAFSAVPSPAGFREGFVSLIDDTEYLDRESA